jgi:hypothetical protein
MNKIAGQQFAHWLSLEHPDIFLSIRKHTLPVNHPAQALGDISDVLSSVGDSLSSAVSAVGDWVSTPSNVTALSSVASAYFKSQTPVVGNAQNAVFQTQLQRAQYGQAPANITYAQNAAGQLMPVYNGQALTPQQLQGMQPTFLQKYGTVLAIGGGAVLLVMILMR